MEKARSRHDIKAASNSTICIYTDRSYINGHIRVVAVLPLKEKIRSIYIGIEATLKVYAAEL